MQNLRSIREKLVRRLAVNYVAYMGQEMQIPNSHINPSWLDGYFQAKKDTEEFLKQLEIYEPYQQPSDSNETT